MSAGALFYLALGALVVTSATSIAARVLHDFSRHELEEYCRRRRREKRFDDILHRHEDVALTLETLQTFSTVLLVLSAALWWMAAVGPSTFAGWYDLLLAAAGGGLLLLAATSWLARGVATLWDVPVVFHLWPLLRVLERVLLPLTLGVRLASKLMHRLAGREEEEEDEEEAFEDEIRTIVSVGLKEGLLEADAREMIEGIIELGDADASDVMTPRSDVDAMPVSLSWPEMLKFVIRGGRTRIPVYEKTIDHIVGVLYVKDILPELTKKHVEHRKSWRKLLRKPWFVPKTMPLDDLLQDFLRSRNHMAIVIDEYHSTAGIVTIEDVLEEIVGEIVDESDREAVQEIKMLSENSAEALGRAHLYQVNEKLGLDLPEPDDYDTIGGFVISKLGRIPKQGETISHDHVLLTVVEANRRRIDRVRVDVLEEAPRETV